MSEEEIGIVVTLALYSITLPYFFFQAVKQKRLGNLKPHKRIVRVIRISVVAAVGLVAILLVLSHTNYLDYQKPMRFSRYDEITFKNFRGIELFRKSLYNNPHFAYIVTSIDYEIYEDSVVVESFFHPSRSYVYSQYTNSTELLQHEKYHFRIAEVFARKIKSQIAEMEHPSKSEINDIITQNLKEERLYQNRYDDDTFHSYVYGEQKKYEKEIDSLLDLFSKHKHSKLPI